MLVRQSLPPQTLPRRSLLTQRLLFSRGATLTRQTIGTPVIPTNGSGASTTDGTSFTTGSVAFAAANMYVVAFAAAGQTAATATPSGWTAVPSTGNQIGSGLSRRLSLFYRTGVTASETIVFASAGETYTSGCWIVVEMSNVDSSLLAQAAVSAGNGQAANTTFTTTLSAFEHPTNINLTFVGLANQNAVTHDSNFAELSPEVQIGSGTLQLEAQWCVNRVACTPSWASTSACVTSLEIKSALG